MVTANNAINNTSGGSNPGASSSFMVINTSNTASSRALVDVNIAGTSADQAYLSTRILGDGGFAQGIKSSDSAFYLVSGTDLTGTTLMTATNGGIFQYPLQPAFLAYQASLQTNATGNGTAYQLGSTTDLTEIYDQGSNFNPATGTFTAPTSARYHFDMNAQLNAITTASQFLGQITTSNRNYIGINDYAVAVALKTVSVSSDIDMDIGDTAVAVLYAAGQGADTVGVYGEATNPYTRFSGNLFA